MAPLPKKTINHFTHPDHQLAEFVADTQFVCDGCKTPGAGRRYRCRHGCDFDLHEFCGNCPEEKLLTFMHLHPLKLVLRKAQSNRQNDRVCDVCRDNVEGLFYRCKGCDFDLHPLCTQLPESLTHVLHQAHPLRLDSSSAAKGNCAVCGGNNCNSPWRYRCAPCGFDIHLDCVLQVVAGQGSPHHQHRERGIPNFGPSPSAHHPPPPPPFGMMGFAPPPYGGYYPYAHYPPAYNMYHNNWVPPQQQPPPNNNQPSGGEGGLGKKMFSLVGRLGFGVLSNTIFGVDLISIFAS